jgi:hypothetical protein
MTGAEASDCSENYAASAARNRVAQRLQPFNRLPRQAPRLELVQVAMAKFMVIHAIAQHMWCIITSIALSTAPTGLWPCPTVMLPEAA